MKYEENCIDISIVDDDKFEWLCRRKHDKKVTDLKVLENATLKFIDATTAT